MKKPIIILIIVVAFAFAVRYLYERHAEQSMPAPTDTSSPVLKAAPHITPPTTNPPSSN